MIAPHEKRKPRTAREVGISCTPAVLREVIHSQSRMPIIDASLSVAASGSCSALRGFRPQELYGHRQIFEIVRTCWFAFAIGAEGCLAGRERILGIKSGQCLRLFTMTTIPPLSVPATLRARNKVQG